MLALGIVPGAALCVRVLHFLPESPRFLVSHGLHGQAATVLERSEGGSKASATGLKELVAASHADDASSSWAQLAANPATRGAVSVACVLALLQQAVGLQSLIYYSPHILRTAGVGTQRSAVYVTVGMAVLKLLCEGGAMLSVDSAGRRPLLLAGAGGVTSALLLIGVALQAKLAGGVGGITASSRVVLLGIGLCVACHALSLGPITVLLLAEICPTSIRGQAMALATTISRGTSFFVPLTFPALVERLDWPGVFYMYAGWAALAALFYALVVPETAGRRLETIAPQFGGAKALLADNLRSLGIGRKQHASKKRR